MSVSVQSHQGGHLRRMVADGPRAVVLVCQGSDCQAPLLGSQCCGHTVVARFCCDDLVPSPQMVEELRRVAADLDAAQTIVFTAAEELLDLPLTGNRRRILTLRALMSLAV